MPEQSQNPVEMESSMDMPNGMLDFELWLRDLQALFTERGWPGDYVKMCGAGSNECFRMGFDDGLSPEEQFDEEMYAYAVSQ